MAQDINLSLLPARRHTASGSLRRVGVEIEFAGPELAAVAEQVAACFGGEILPDTDYEIRVRSPELGEFRVEVDVSLLKNLGQQRAGQAQTPGALEQFSEELLASLLRQLAPLEIVTPPLPMERLPELDALVARLGNLGGEGTDAALLYAFGVHFNPEAPSLEAADILAHLRAFVLLYDWLKAELKVDPARRLSPFIRPFPKGYAQRLLQPSYRPDRDTLIDDYLRFNPTRNRALDLLPLFAHLDRERVFGVVPDPLINPRPTYHYRLSNSRVGDPHWRLSGEWRYWLVVEALAANPPKLQAMGADYLALLDRPLGDIFSQWTTKTAQWLNLI